MIERTTDRGPAARAETHISRRAALSVIGGAVVAIAIAPALPVLAEPAPLPLRTLDGREVQVVYPHMEDNLVAAVLLISACEDCHRLVGINTSVVRDAAAERALLGWARRRIDQGKIFAVVFAHEDFDA